MEEKDMKVGPEAETVKDEFGESVMDNVSENIQLPPNTDKPAHHHHHHHSHRKRRRSSSSSKKTNNKKQEKIKAFFKNNKKKLINIVVAMALVISLIFIAVIMDNKGDSEIPVNDTTSSVSEEPVINALQIEIPLFAEDVTIAGAGVSKYMDSDISVGCDSVYREFKKYGRLDISTPVLISYKIMGMPSDCTVKKSVIRVADNENYENAFVYELGPEENTAYADFLCADTTYFFKISVTLSNKTTTDVEGSFTTADTPSFLNVDGVYNMRDIGGWKTEDGKKIKRGLLYRGSEIDGAVEDHYTITQEGIRKMLKVLGVRFEMDLRASDVNVAGTDILGKSVIHKYYSESGATEYSNIFSDDISVKNAVRDMFKDLANPENYPVYMHCTYGTDRTGTICYLLGALLGMSEDDLMREYQLSALHHGVVNDAIYTFVEDFKKLEGDTLQEKAEGYLISVGVTQEEIESIKTIFLE